jgi:hypothetical protein
MKPIKEIIRIQPQIADVKSGAEPSIVFMMMHYYTSHGIPALKASEIVGEYIAALEVLAENK